MNHHDEDIIMSAKRIDAEKHLKAAYERHYLGDGSDPVNICRVLLDICSRYKLIQSYVDLVDEIAPANAWKYGKHMEDDYWTRVKGVLISTVRHAEMSEF